jgi:hypothetical protein
MKKLYTIITTIIITLSFSACGGGGSDAEFTGDLEIKVPDCNNATTAYRSTDTLIATADNTTVKLIKKSNGKQEVCTNSGSAVLR